MEENSIEKDEEILNNIKAFMQESINKGCHKFIYNDYTKLSLSRKLKSYLKLKSLINLDKQVNDIVDASMKIEE